MAEPQSPPPVIPDPDAPGRPAPLDPPMVPFAVAGLVGWAVVGLVLVIFFRDWLARTGRTDWLWICVAGFGIGLVGLAAMLRHDAQRRRRHAAERQPAQR